MMHSVDAAASPAGEQSMDADPAPQDEDHGYDGDATLHAVACVPVWHGNMRI